MTENESPYVAYLKTKSVEFEPESVVDEAVDDEADLSKLVQDKMLKDKDLIDKSQDAFVSFLRYYKEH